MFSGKESSNRIELSRLVQDLLNFWCFGLPVALGREQVGGEHLGAWGVSHTYAHARACMHMHTCTFIHV